MNFNYGSKPVYKLNANLQNELINLYGISVKYLKTEKINKDINIFGDYSHLKSDGNKIYDLIMLPENSESFDMLDYGFSNFGLLDTNNIKLFVSRKSIELAHPNIDTSRGFDGILGNLIITPSNKMFEITDIDFMTPGINNLFTEIDSKSVYAITCKPYDIQLINELNNRDITKTSTGPVPNTLIGDEQENEEDPVYTNLDSYFSEIIDIKNEQDDQTTNIDINSSKAIINNTIINKPIIDNSEDDVFGKFK